MSTLRALKKLILGETWFLPLGIAATLAVAGLIESLPGDDWPHVGGPLLLAAVVAVLLVSVARSARRR